MNVDCNDASLSGATLRVNRGQLAFPIGPTGAGIELEAERVASGKTEWLIGRHPACDVCLTDDSSVSRRHARVTYRPDGWSSAAVDGQEGGHGIEAIFAGEAGYYLEDLGSLHGTFVAANIPPALPTPDDVTSDRTPKHAPSAPAAPLESASAAPARAPSAPAASAPSTAAASAPTPSSSAASQRAREAEFALGVGTRLALGQFVRLHNGLRLSFGSSDYELVPSSMPLASWEVQEEAGGQSNHKSPQEKLAQRQVATAKEALVEAKVASAAAVVEVTAARTIVAEIGNQIKQGKVAEARLREEGDQKRAKAKAKKNKSLQKELEGAEKAVEAAAERSKAAEISVATARAELADATASAKGVRQEERHKAWRQRVGPRVRGYAEAKAVAKELLTTTGGHRDRKSGAFAIPEEDTAEPMRTERILASPFVCCRRRAGDAFQAREGFLLFRVNGSNRVGLSYRVLVLFINVCFGILSGVAPLLGRGSPMALAQAAIVLSLQVLMAMLCGCFLPDADRIVSRIAATQFLAESVSTASLLGAMFVPTTAVADTAAAAADAAARQAALKSFLMNFGFCASLMAMAMPMLQLIEQRLLTPAVLVIRNKTGDTMSLGAAAYLLIMNLPRQIFRMKDALAMAADGDGGGDAAAGATADAGDDEGGGETGGGGGGGGGEDEETKARKAFGMVQQGGAGASKLLARAAGAKEMAGKVLPPANSKATPAPSVPVKEAWGPSGDSGTAADGATAASRSTNGNRQGQQNGDLAVDDADDDGGGGE